MELIAKLGVDIRGPDGSPLQVQAGEVVVFYFSAHWCPPCRQFTPLLAKVHALAQGAASLVDGRYTRTPPQPLHVIFVSGDHSLVEMKSYMKESHGQWSSVSFGTPGQDALNQHFNVQGIPAIHVCAPSGVAAPGIDARNDVMRAGTGGDAAAVADLVQRWRAAAGVRPDVLPCGVQVELAGLKQDELNGQVCEVVGADLASERVRVRLSDGRVVAIRRPSCAQRAFGTVGSEIVELKPSEEGYIVDCKQVAASDVIPSPGTVVRIEGLQAKPEKNGSWGTARAFDSEAGRVEVEVSATEVLKLRPNNLRI